jgi:hypothetical protein
MPAGRNLLGVEGHLLLDPIGIQFLHQEFLQPGSEPIVPKVLHPIKDVANAGAKIPGFSVMYRRRHSLRDDSRIYSIAPLAAVLNPSHEQEPLFSEEFCQELLRPPLGTFDNVLLGLDLRTAMTSGMRDHDVWLEGIPVIIIKFKAAGAHRRRPRGTLLAEGVKCG